MFNQDVIAQSSCENFSLVIYAGLLQSFQSCFSTILMDMSLLPGFFLATLINNFHCASSISSVLLVPRQWIMLFCWAIICSKKIYLKNDQHTTYKKSMLWVWQHNILFPKMTFDIVNTDIKQRQCFMEWLMILNIMEIVMRDLCHPWKFLINSWHFY